MRKTIKKNAKTPLINLGKIKSASKGFFDCTTQHISETTAKGGRPFQDSEPMKHFC